MEAFITDWLNILLRWAHLIAGIGWIGTSFYFVALDMSLKKREKMREGVYGTAWEVHGGGFYHVEKFSVAPKELPSDLIWYKWEAYLTWFTGILLMTVQFYWNAETWMIDPAVLEMSKVDAVALSIGSFAGGWLIYDRMCRSPIGKDPYLLGALTFLLILLAAYLYTNTFSARSALIHVGAFVGTLMAANVFGIIIPNQKKIADALMAGKTPDPIYGAIGKQRSMHNTYLTLPVLLMMVSGHYPMLSNHPHAWLIVGFIIAIGAAGRHFLVRHEVGDGMDKIGWCLPIIAVAFAGALAMTWPEDRFGDVGPVEDAEALRIVQTHCISCHAAIPTDTNFEEPPKNIVLESLDDIRRSAALVMKQSVFTEAMPLGNQTEMTDEERVRLGAWLQAN